MVLSPSSARKNAVPTAMTARLPARLTFSCSSSVRVSPRRVQKPKAMNASAATRLIQPVGRAAPSPKPDGDGHQMDDGGGDRDAEQHRPHPEPGGEGQGHELRFVAQLGDEDDAESDECADENCVHGTGWASLIRPGRDARP